MPREHEFYRDVLADIIKRVGDKTILTTSDVAAYCGKSRGWCMEHFSISPTTKCIHVCVFARELCRGGK